MCDTKAFVPRVEEPMRSLLSIILLLSLLTGSTACKDDAPGTRLQMLPLSYSVPAGLNPIRAHGLVRRNISSEQARFEQETGVAWGEWARIQPSRASLFITEPGLNWGFAAEVSLKAFTDDSLNLKELFYRDQIPIDIGARLDMIPTDFDAREILDSDRFGLVLELRSLRTATPQQIPVTLEYSFEAFE